MAQESEIAEVIVAALKGGHKVLTFGNGGSATQAQHMALELVGRCVRDRDPLAAICLSSDAGLLTALANDYGFKYVFSRQVYALGQEGDVAIGLSTSGSSENVVEALLVAQALGLHTVGLTGEHSGALKGSVDLWLSALGTSTPRVQEEHLRAIHHICELVEEQVGGTIS